MQVPGMFGEGGAALWGETGRDHWNPTAGWGRLAVCLSTRSLHLSGMMLASSMGIAHTSHSSLNQLPFKKSIQLLALPWWIRWERICLQCRRPWFDPWVRKIT